MVETKLPTEITRSALKVGVMMRDHDLLSNR
jgi:hypothetical protein